MRKAAQNMLLVYRGGGRESTAETPVQMLKFKTAKPEKAAQVVARQIKQAVLSGDLSVDEKLPAERDLIVQFGYSRSVVREALRLLEDDGLIRLKAGRNGGAARHGASGRRRPDRSV